MFYLVVRWDTMPHWQNVASTMRRKIHFSAVKESTDVSRTNSKFRGTSNGRLNLWITGTRQCVARTWFNAIGIKLTFSFEIDNIFIPIFHFSRKLWYQILSKIFYKKFRRWNKFVRKKNPFWNNNLIAILPDSCYWNILTMFVPRLGHRKLPLNNYNKNKYVKAKQIILGLGDLSPAYGDLPKKREWLTWISSKDDTIRSSISIYKDPKSTYWMNCIHLWAMHFYNAKSEKKITSQIFYHLFFSLFYYDQSKE